MTLVLFLLALFAADPSGPVRIGYGEAPPYCYTRHGRPAGFQIDVFNEAARREGVRLEWVRTGSSEDNTRALAEGRLDVLPMAPPFEERKKLLYVGQPWWKEETILLVRADAQNVDPAKPARIAFPRILLPGAGAHYTRAQLIITVSAPQALEHVCRDTADAALIGSTYIRDLVNARPDACATVPLRIYDSPVTGDFSIIAGMPSRGTAERLYRGVTGMMADGTLSRIAGRHPPISSPYATRMSEELQARYRSQRLSALLVSVFVILTAAAFVLVRQIISHRRLKLLLEQQLRTEHELRESQAVLRERTMDLVRSNEDLQAFAYSVSHDLQEPVRTQVLYSELLDRRFRDVLPAEARSFLKVIRTSALRTQEMMRSVLLYSRAGQSDQPGGLVDCNAVVAAVAGDLRALIAQTGATVSAEPLPVIRGWEERLQQVFQNLIENAIKYRRPDAAPRIVVSCVRIGGEWQFSVADNGIGFSAEYAEKVFGLFKRLHGHERYGGSGIGLALCKRVVERHGGRIWAESREGEGSTFYFTLPVSAEDPDDIAAPEQTAAG